MKLEPVKPVLRANQLRAFPVQSQFHPGKHLCTLQVDIIKASCLPVLKRFLGTDEGLELKVKRLKPRMGSGGCPEVWTKDTVRPPKKTCHLHR